MDRNLTLTSFQSDVFVYFINCFPVFIRVYYKARVYAWKDIKSWYLLMFYNNDAHEYKIKLITLLNQNTVLLTPI